MPELMAPHIIFYDQNRITHRKDRAYHWYVVRFYIDSRYVSCNKGYREGHLPNENDAEAIILRYRKEALAQPHERDRFLGAYERLRRSFKGPLWDSLIYAEKFSFEIKTSKRSTK